MSLVELHDEIRACKRGNRRPSSKLARMSAVALNTRETLLSKMKADIELCIQVEINRNMIHRLDTATSIALKAIIQCCETQQKLISDLSSKIEELNEKIASLSASGS